MGKKSVAKKPKAKDRSDVLVLTHAEYADLEKKTFKAAYDQARKEFKESTEKTLHAVYGCAELNALVQMIRLTALGTRDLFGFGKTRIARLVEYILRQYDCILDDHVTFADIYKEIREATGLKMPILTQEELTALMQEELDNGRSILPLFREIKGVEQC